MPKVTIHKSTKETPKQAFDKVKLMLEGNPDLQKLDAGYKCVFNQTDLSGTATGKLFKANMSIKEQSTGSAVEIVVDLPLALALAKGLVQKTLEKKLNEILT